MDNECVANDLRTSEPGLHPYPAFRTYFSSLSLSNRGRIRNRCPRIFGSIIIVAACIRGATCPYVDVDSTGIRNVFVTPFFAFGIDTSQRVPENCVWNACALTHHRNLTLNVEMSLVVEV